MGFCVVCLDPSRKIAGWHLCWVATASIEVFSIPSPEMGVPVASCNIPKIYYVQLCWSTRLAGTNPAVSMAVCLNLPDVLVTRLSRVGP